MKLKSPLLYILVLLTSTGYSDDYVWIGNGGNWSDISHWYNNTTAGPATVVPSITDNVTFNAASFSSAGQTVTIDINGACANMTFTGITNSPTITGGSGITLEVAGNMTLSSAATYSFIGTVNYSGMTGSSPFSITSNGKSLGNDVLFFGNGKEWELQDNFIVPNELGISDGTLDMQGHDVSCTSLNANKSTNSRAIDFNGSTVTISGTGTVCDLRGDDTNLTLSNSSTSTLSFTHTNDITMETGDETKEIPNISVVNCTKNFTINTGPSASTSKTITFNNITALANGVDFDIDPGTTDCNEKVYGAISMPDNVDASWGHPHGSGFASNTSVFGGTFTTGTKFDGIFVGDYVQFNGIINLGNNSEWQFTDKTDFNNTINIAGTNTRGIINKDEARFQEDVNINGSSKWQLRLSSFDKNINISGGSTVSIINNNNSVKTVTGNVNVGSGTTLNLGGSYYFGKARSVWNINGTLTLNSESTVQLDNGNKTFTIGTIDFKGSNALELSDQGKNNVTTFISTGLGCSNWVSIKCVEPGVQANLQLVTNQTINAAVVQDIKIQGTTKTLTSSGGYDMGNNESSQVSFSSPATPTTLYWVGGNTIAVAANKGGTFTTGNNDNWSNPDNWSVSSGTYSGANQCLPGPQDNAVFDDLSFNHASHKTVNVDAGIVSLTDMDWSPLTTSGTMNGTATTEESQVINIYGDLTFDGNMTNDFNGKFVFQSNDGSDNNITSDGVAFKGPIEFNTPGVTFEALDAMSVDNNDFGDIDVIEGTLDMNGNDLSLTDDFHVHTGATFVHGGGAQTVTFNGQATNTGSQTIDIDGTGSFNNLTVNRGTNGTSPEDEVALSSPITVENNLNIAVGMLDDTGNQITGSSGSGIFTIGNGAYLQLGKKNASTSFPTNYVSARISLDDNSKVRYSSRVSAQSISSAPSSYGDLFFNNGGGGALTDKTLLGNIQVNGKLKIDDYNNLIDDGYQISGLAGQTFEMDKNSQYTHGKTGSTNTFPTGFTVFDLEDNGNGSLIIYNSDNAQTIKAINGTGNNRYCNLQLATGGGSSVKTLGGDVVLNGDFTIDANTTIDASGSNFKITLKSGDLNNSGTFTAQNGTVEFQGTHTFTQSGSGDFYNIIMNGTALNLSSPATVTNNMTLTSGLINTTSVNLLNIADGATVGDGSPGTAGSASSYVDGPMKKIGNDDNFTFPVGDAGIWARLQMRDIGNYDNATEFTCEYIRSNAPNGGNRGAGIAHVSGTEYWDLDRTSDTGNDAECNVRIYWEDETLSQITDVTDLTIAHYSSTTSLWEDHVGIGVDLGTNGYVTSTTKISNFSPTAPASKGGVNPLPIELLSFEAHLNINQVDLKWVTESEKNNDYFTVERSQDGESFEEVLSIKGAGNSNSHLEYFDVDYTPLIGVTYYRLKQVDFDGKYTYSGLVPVEYTGDENPGTSLFGNVEAEIKLWPNPNEGTHVNIEMNGYDPEHEVLVVVRDITGREFYSKVLITDMDGHLITAIDPYDRLAPGSYLITGSDKNHLYSKKLIVE